MKKAMVAAVLALAGLGALPAHSLVDIDEDAHLYARFVSGDTCVTLYAWDAAHPYADTGSVYTDPGMWVDVYLQEATCEGDYRYLWAYSDYGDQALVTIDPTASLAIVNGSLANDDGDAMDVRVVFRADDELPTVDPSVTPGPPLDTYAAFGRSGTASGTFEGAGVSLAEVASVEAGTWSSHWASIG